MSDQSIMLVKAYVSYDSKKQASWNMKKASSPPDYLFTLNQARRNICLGQMILIYKHYSVCVHFIWKLEAM